MRRNEQVSEPDDDGFKDNRGRTGRAYPAGESDDDEEYVGVAHQRGQAPLREQEEEDVAEEDIVEILEDDDTAKRDA
jgi:hypothetical protein